MDSVTNIKVYLDIPYKTITIQIKRLKIISKIHKSIAFHALSFKNCFQQAEFFQFLYTTASLSRAEESLFRVVLWSSPLKALKEVIKPLLENSKSLKTATYSQSSNQA